MLTFMDLFVLPFVVLFAVLQGYSFSVGKLNTLLLTLFERYAQLLRDRFSSDFQQVRTAAPSGPIANFFLLRADRFVGFAIAGGSRNGASADGRQ